MTMPSILVTGGTGTLGQQVVPRLRQAGRDVRVLSRRTRGPLFVTGDLATGAGAARARSQGAGTIVHCASSRKGDAAGRAEPRPGRARRLPTSQAGPPHLVYISIVGVDRFPHGYYKAKLEAERVIAGSGLPWTTLRATQFYELIAKGRRPCSRSCRSYRSRPVSWSSRSIPARSPRGSPNSPWPSRRPGTRPGGPGRSSASPT